MLLFDEHEGCEKCSIPTVDRNFRSLKVLIEHFGEPMPLRPVLTETLAEADALSGFTLTLATCKKASQNACRDEAEKVEQMWNYICRQRRSPTSRSRKLDTSNNLMAGGEPTPLGHELGEEPAETLEDANDIKDAQVMEISDTDGCSAASNGHADDEIMDSPEHQTDLELDGSKDLQALADQYPLDPRPIGSHLTTLELTLGKQRWQPRIWSLMVPRICKSKRPQMTRRSWIHFHHASISRP